MRLGTPIIELLDNNITGVYDLEKNDTIETFLLYILEKNNTVETFFHLVMFKKKAI